LKLLSPFDLHSIARRNPLAPKRNISIHIEIPLSTMEKKLEELADEVIEPIKASLTPDEIKKLKELFGDDIATINIGSLQADAHSGRAQGAPIITTSGGGGYASRAWGKATCA
jgi:hypothetical protein